MAVRPATMADRFAVLRLGRAFIEGLGILPFAAAYAEQTVKAYIDQPDKLCLVLASGDAVQGFLMAHAAPHPFWPVKAAGELAWWIAPEHRGRGAVEMVRAYEAWAAEQGCGLIGMAHLGDYRLTEFYRRRGYVPAENHFLKVT